MYRLFIILTILFLLISKFALAENDSVYFSFDKRSDLYLVAIEGYIINKNKKYNLDELNYEWIINYSANFEEFKTSKPLLVFTPKERNFMGKVKIYPNDNSFFKSYNFTFNIKAKPRVSIVRYLENLNVVLPFTKYNPGEKLFPLIFNFSSNNLSYTWKVKGKYYSAIMLDPSDINEETEIQLFVNNLDSNEFASDKIIFSQ